jgi:outer membrane protein assembly factor BamB
MAGPNGFSALAYDGQRVFVLNWSGLTTAYQASTGKVVWSDQMPGQWQFSAPPTGYDGVLYVTGSGSQGTLYAVSESDGSIMWQQTVQNGDHSSPAVDDTGVYVSFSCQEDYRFTLDGSLAWNHATGCNGGGGSTVVLHDRRVYARGFPAGSDKPVILSAATGTEEGPFPPWTTPAFESTTMFTVDNSTQALSAAAETAGSSFWTYGGHDLVTAPVTNHGVVYAGSSNGVVYGVSVATGREVWSGVAGTAIGGPDEASGEDLIGMTIGDGLLLVPAGGELTAFGG